MGILENDFGAVYVDMFLLQELMGDKCELEMIAGGCVRETHRRRFRTKLIAMGMCGYDRVLVEPSGIFDMDEFFDALHEEPLDRWYAISNVITIIDAALDQGLSKDSRYILASQTAHAGTVLYSHVQEVSPAQLEETRQFVTGVMNELHMTLPAGQTVFQKDWTDQTTQDFRQIMSSGYHGADYAKLWMDSQKTYDSLYFMNMEFTEDFLQKSCHEILNDPACGKVFRIKGFQKLPDESWIAVNATLKQTQIHPIAVGQAILIVIGENLNREAIEGYWGRSRP